MNYFDKLAAAYVRGSAKAFAETPDFLSVPLEEMNDEQARAAIESGKKAGLKMYHFKEKSDLPRVKTALGFLKSIYPENLLDVGSGRGAFLFPFLRDFPNTSVTSLDILPHRVAFLQAIHDGGIDRLTVENQDICTWNVPDNSFDVVTILEVLEHIPEVEKAIANAVRIAKRYVVISVPSKPDDNPEHIHLLTKERLTGMFERAGIKRLRFDGVNGHLFMTAAKE